MITKKDELKAIRQSIKHWCIDIRRPLLKGDKIVTTSTQTLLQFPSLKWEKSGDPVILGSTSCALCKLMGQCGLCPLYITTKKICNEPKSLYRIFHKCYDISAANTMISALIQTYWQHISPAPPHQK